MDIIDLDTIRQNLDPPAVISAIESGFASYSDGGVTVPPVGHLPFPGGDCHIKYGYISGDPFFVIKIASGSHRNAELGVSPSGGMMVICSATTGHPVAVLRDEGHLTDVRTAMAGAIAAKYLMPPDVRRIGVIGRGIQAGLQLEYLKYVTDCRDVTVWNHRNDNLTEFTAALAERGFSATVAGSADELAGECQLIVTTTPSTQAMIGADAAQPGTHITAVGADTPGKQELDPALISRADVIVVDSRSQCMDHGEIQAAVAAGDVTADDLVELGEVIAAAKPGRTSAEQITIADLTGVAVQDIAISCAVYAAWQKANGHAGDNSLPD